MPSKLDDCIRPRGMCADFILQAISSFDPILEDEEDFWRTRLSQYKSRPTTVQTAAVPLSELSKSEYVY